VLVTSVHGLPPAAYRTAGRVLRMTTRRVVACAPAVAASLAAAGYPRANMRVVLNGARLDPPGAGREAGFRARHGLPDGPIVAGVGRLVEQKAWHTAIEAMAGVPEATLVIAGDGPLETELEARARAAGSAVRFLGAVDDVAALLGQSACVLSTSTWEGLPLTLLEAASLGMPVVASAVDGVADIFEDGSALLIPPGRPDAARDAVRRVLADGSLRVALGARARELSERWTPEAMLRGYRAAYEAACTGARWAEG
jgi:glycosyltransferase involved in cell wall biosynthesis